MGRQHGPPSLWADGGGAAGTKATVARLDPCQDATRSPDPSLIPMTKPPVLTPTVRRFLAKARLARVCTIGLDGYPHVVPMFFARQGDEIFLGTDRDEAKVRNALRNPKAAIVVGGDPDCDEAGYMVQGDLAVELDPSPAAIRRLLLRYETGEEARIHEAEWRSSRAVLLRLRPKKVIRVW
jgi:nitroimidazol reductase NimA-like FMN-containing flavoprotein (pyridoxamine 5'-phosphate oxidase superfamily)